MRIGEKIGEAVGGEIYCLECPGDDGRDYLLADKPNNRAVRCGCCGRDIEQIAGLITDSERREPLDRCNC